MPHRCSANSPAPAAGACGRRRSAPSPPIPESVELLATISSDKTERTAVRELAAMSLKAASPTRFADVARDIVLDEQEDDAPAHHRALGGRLHA